MPQAVEPVVRAESQVETVIEPTSGWKPLRLREAWEARHLLATLVRRNVRLPRAELDYHGFWTLLRPVVFMAVFLLIKRRSGAAMGEGVPYALYVYSGLVLWWYFVGAVQGATRAVYQDQELITKVYYPRLLTPVVPVLAGLSDLALQAALLPVGMLWFMEAPGAALALLPLVVLQVMALALGIGLWAAALSMDSKDALSILDYVLYVGMFLSPVIYSPALLAERMRGFYYALNPMAAPLEMFRAALFQNVAAPWTPWLGSLGVTAAVLVTGAYAFKRVEIHLADRVA